MDVKDTGKIFSESGYKKLPNFFYPLSKYIFNKTAEQFCQLIGYSKGPNVGRGRCFVNHRHVFLNIRRLYLRSEGDYINLF
jgi:hypothetical protein